MKYNTSLNRLAVVALTMAVASLTGCPEPSNEERETLLINRSQSQISDNQGIASEKLCASHDNMKHIYRSNNEFAEKWFNCSETIGWVPPAAKLKVECMKEAYPSMTEHCLGCFNKMTSCSAEFCWASCATDSKGGNCQKCSIEKCSDEMFRCSGVPAIEIPDFERNG